MAPISTKSLKAILQLCNEVQDESGTAGLLGYPGDGKSYCLDVSMNARDNRYILRLGKSFKSYTVYTELIESMGISFDYKMYKSDYMYQLIRAIARTVNASEEPYLIVIDEAGKATAEMLEYFHELRDLTYGHCGFIFAGPHYFQGKLTNWIQQNQPGILEFSRRIESWVEIKHPTKSEMTEYCIIQGITELKDTAEIIKKCVTWSDLISEVKRFLKKRKL